MRARFCAGIVVCFIAVSANVQVVTIDRNVKMQTITDISGNLAKNCFAFRFWAPGDSTTDMLDPIGRRFLSDFKPAIVARGAASAAVGFGK